MDRENNIMKVWGQRQRIFKNDKCEIDYLQLLPKSHCSIHTHAYKINKFFVIEGKVTINSGFGETILSEGASLTIHPPLVHQFCTGLISAKMIEIAYVDEGEIDIYDIDRQKQGGRIIKGTKFTLEEMLEKNLSNILGENID